MACARMSLNGLLPLVRNVWLLRSPDSQRAWERALACAGAGRATAIAPAATRAVTIASTRAARRMRDPFIFILSFGRRFPAGGASLTGRL